MMTNESLRQQNMDLLKQKMCELGRKVTMQDVKDDPRLPSPNSYAFYSGSFSRAVDDCWSDLLCEASQVAATKRLEEAKAAKSPESNATADQESQARSYNYDEMLEYALELCEEFERVPRKRQVWAKAAKDRFREMITVLGKGDFQRTLRVVQDEWDVRHPEKLRDSSDLLSLEELDWTQEDWIRWLSGLDSEQGKLWQSVKREYPTKYQRILALFGDWMTVERFLNRKASGNDEMSEVSRKLESERDAVRLENETNEANPEEEVGRIRVILQKMTERLGHIPTVANYKKLEDEFDAPEYAKVRALVGKVQIWPEFLGEPWKSMGVTQVVTSEMETEVESMAADERTEKMVEEMTEEMTETRTEEVTEETMVEEVVAEKVVEDEAMKPKRKSSWRGQKRIRMSSGEMRAFVLEAMREFGGEMTTRQYSQYANEHYGPSIVTLRKYGLGTVTWAKIWEEESKKLTVGHNLSENDEQTELEQAKDEMKKLTNGHNLPEEKASETKEVDSSEDKTPKAKEGSSFEDSVPEAKGIDLGSLNLGSLLQVMIHGVDTTIVIGGVEMQVRIDFGPKK